jgi:hypothetical protein
MAAAGANPSGYAPRTESGVQVDSSVAHHASRRHMTAGLPFLRALLIVVGRLRPAVGGTDGPRTDPRATLAHGLCTMPPYPLAFWAS